MICPKCNFEQNATHHECVKCGIIFEKYHASQQARNTGPPQSRVASEQTAVEAEAGVISIANQLLFHVPDEVSAVSFWARAVLLAALFAWSWTIYPAFH